MSCPEAGRALKSAGFRRLNATEAAMLTSTSIFKAAGSSRD
jgi:hypothetical protein